MPHSNTAKRPTGPAPMIATSVLWVCPIATFSRQTQRILPAGAPWIKVPIKRCHRAFRPLQLAPTMGDSTQIDLILPDPAATERLAAIIAAEARAGDAILLSGDLGAGKTHFARAFINALTAAPEEVPSPTFTLVQTYDALALGVPVKIWHFDLYRLKAPDETLELGIEDAFAEAISLVEW